MVFRASSPFLVLGMMRPERFEFTSASRGPMTALTWEGFTVLLTEWPESLFSALRAGVLGPGAEAEARELVAALEQDW